MHALATSVDFWVFSHPERRIRWFRSVLVTVGGGVSIALLARISIPLPFSPVPITGQTFGVYLIALLWGRRLGPAATIFYLGLGWLELPVLAQGHVGFFGPTTGYLIGMVFASAVIGNLADRGWSKSWGKAYLACGLGSLLVFACGLFVLSNFVPRSQLLLSGVLPFLPGDLVKSLAAAFIASRIESRKAGDESC